MVSLRHYHGWHSLNYFLSLGGQQNVIGQAWLICKCLWPSATGSLSREFLGWIMVQFSKEKKRILLSQKQGEGTGRKKQQVSCPAQRYIVTAFAFFFVLPDCPFLEFRTFCSLHIALWSQKLHWSFKKICRMSKSVLKGSLCRKELKQQAWGCNLYKGLFASCSLAGIWELGF